jgi:hypothetical protein
MRDWDKFYEKDCSSSEHDEFGIWFSRWAFEDIPAEDCIVQYNGKAQIVSKFKLKSWKQPQ